MDKKKSSEEDWLNSLNYWSKANVSKDKTFDDLLNIDGVPLWWFYKPYLFLGMLRYPLASLLEIKKQIQKKEKISLYKKGYISINSFFLRKFIKMNEQVKQIVSEKRNTFQNRDKNVLFLTYTNYVQDAKLEKISRIQKLLHKLKDDKKVNSLVLVVDPLSNFSPKNLRYPNMIYGFMRDVDKKMVKRMAKNTHEKWKSIKNKDKIIKNYDYIMYHLDILFSYEFLFLTYLYYETFREIIKKYDIKLIFLTGGGTLLDRCALAAANKEGILSLFSSHGYTSTFGSDWFFLKKAKFAVFGQNQEDDMIKRGALKKNIHKTGALIMDDLKVSIYKKKDSEGKSILFLTQAAVEKNIVSKDLYFDSMKKYLKDISRLNVPIVVKLHPAENHIEEYKKIASSLKIKNILITKEGKTNEFIRKSDVVVTFRSSVILNSLIYNKPVICMDLLDEIVITDYDLTTENNALIIGSKTTDLAKTIGRLFKDREFLKMVMQKQKGYEEYFFYKVDGKAYERIANLIYKLVK